jgi:hypothetical protein
LARFFNMRIQKSFTYVLLQDDGMQIAGVHGHGMVVRKEALAWSSGPGLTQQMMRSTLLVHKLKDMHAEFYPEHSQNGSP